MKEDYRKALEVMAEDKGRPNYFEYLASGLGSGPWIQLADGSVKMDLITGIGIHFLGHSHPAVVSAMLDACASDVLQGNLQPGVEAYELTRLVLSNVGSRSKLHHASLACSGTMANENAIKIIRQKHFPATRIFAFTDCFAGRSTTMAEITDSPKYREGQPVYGEVTYLPFYEPEMGLERNLRILTTHMEWELERHPKKYAAVMMEIIQGEGGFRHAPREWYLRIFELARKHGLGIWFDEVQTFGRTTQLFGYQHLGLEEFPDVVTVGKLLQACMTLYSKDYNPRPGLIAGTFTGGFATLRGGVAILKHLLEGGYYGPEGLIAKKSAYWVENLKRLQAGSLKGLLGEIRAHGGMIGFVPLQGTAEDVKNFLMKLFQNGVVAFQCGHGPYLCRLLPPLGVMTEQEIDLANSVIEKTLLEMTGAQK
jgi:acetylornithine/N-succinyldiaminopimelate aminotransferase